MYARIRYNLKKPGNGRATFAIVKDTITPEGERIAETVKDERISALNGLYKEGLKSATVVEIELRAIIDEWHTAEKRRRGALTFNDDNRRIFENLWEQRYKDKDIIDHASARNRLSRAIEALGPLSLVSASRDILQKTINRGFKGNKHRDIVAALNQLLRYAGRDIQLHAAKKERHRISHLSEDDMDAVLQAPLPELYKLLFATAFATGARTGEAFAMTPESIVDGVVYISGQLDRDELERETKNRLERHTVVNKRFLKYVLEWANIPVLERLPIRALKHSDVLQEACKKAFPESPEKWAFTVKDLRHSYAIWLLSRGVSLSLVAQSLGNSILVCQENYGGFVLSPDSVQAIKAILKVDKPE